MSNTKNVLGIDIGGTKIAVCVADSNGNVLANDRIPGATLRPYAEILPELAALCKSLVAKAGLKMDDISCCGICAPGPLDMKAGSILHSPNIVWEDVPIRDDVRNALGINTVLENDANAGVLAELFFGSAKGLKDVVYLTMSTGVGGGIICGGKLLTGTTGIAGELGHIVLEANGGPICGCGQSGCLEAYCGGRSVAMRIQEKLRMHPHNPMFALPGVDGKLENLNFQAVREGAKLGIPVAVEMWDEICLRLAQGIGIIMVTFNPEMVILGTSAYYAGDFMLKPVLEKLPRFTWRECAQACKVIITELGPKIGELAGASVALNAVMQ